MESMTQRPFCLALVGLLLAFLIYPVPAVHAEGWYLMIPPIEEAAELRGSISPPVTRKWQNLSAHDTASDCQRHRQLVIDRLETEIRVHAARVDKRLEELRSAHRAGRREVLAGELEMFFQKDEDAKVAIALSGWSLLLKASLCTASDDPRLR